MQHINPTQALALPSEGLVKLPVVMSATTLSRSVIYERVKSGDFPAPVKLGERAVAWPVESIRAWIASRVDAATAAKRPSPTRTQTEPAHLPSITTPSTRQRKAGAV